MAPDLAVVAAAVVLPFLAAVVTPLVYRIAGERTGYVGAAVAAASFALLVTQLGTEGAVAVQWIPAIDVAVRFYVDGWALLFGMLASGIGVVVFTYSATYMHGGANLARYYGTLLAFMGSILGVALAGDVILLFLFWELTSLCSFVLIGHHTEDADSRYSARMAMVVTVGGGLCLLAGLLLLAVVSGGVLDGTGVAVFDLTAILANPDAVETALRETGTFAPVLGLFAIAAAAKSAQVPLHFWLPNAMVAPTPVSAFLHSATMVKVGVYFVGRVRPLLLGEEWTALFATLGLVTMTVGALLAVVATDSKELLAYSTASHLGLLVAAFGFGSHYGAEAGSFHLLNHGLFKAALFLVAGIVAHEAGTRDLTELGGLWRELPVTAAVTGVAALSMAGFPPFNGFHSKELLFEAAYDMAVESGGVPLPYPAVAVFASVFTVVYSLRFLWIFLGDRPAALDVHHRPSLGLLAPPAALAVLALFIGLFPQAPIDTAVGAAVDATAPGTHDVTVAFPTYISGPVVMSLVTFGLGIAAFPAADRIQAVLGRVVAAGTPIWPTRVYDRLLSGTDATSAWLGPWIHDNSLRTYVFWALAAASALSLVGYAATAVSVPPIDGLGAPVAVALVLVVAVIAAVAVTTAPSHVAGVLTLSILGFMIAIFYVLASAPDLALTQLIVETLVLLVFLLVLEELPAFYHDLQVGVAVRDVGLSLAVGATAFVSVLVAARDAAADPTATADYYVSQAVPGAGGTNVVNVVLVDFRGFDTLGELLVVTVAAVAILVLVTMRTRSEEDLLPDGGDSE
jgi:multicomponent Na+:H+ antiporter subunit A